MLRNLALSVVAVGLFSALAACTTSSPVALGQVGSDRLQTLTRAPESEGTLIYRGDVYPLSPADAAPLFTYQRRVDRSDDGMRASHITRNADGEAVALEFARFTPDYEVQRFEAIHKVAGYSGSVDVSPDGHLEYVLDEGGRITTASEDVTDPVVSGPSLHGWMLRHWDDLAAGKAKKVRMIVLTRKETFGFELKRVPAPDGIVAFSMKPTNLLVRLAVAPLRLEFDAATRNVLRYTGRVPPMILVDGKRTTLDARVEYALDVPMYR
jgi:hypothetical protein